jgi:hypothetical protein
LFVAAISAWGRTQLPNAAPKAEILLDKMMLLYDLTKSEKLKPNSQHFIAGTFISINEGALKKLLLTQCMVNKSHQSVCSAKSTRKGTKCKASIR